MNRDFGEEIKILMPPEYDWSYTFGSGGMWYMVEKGKEPNRFYRLMQHRLLGITWKRNKPTEISE